MLKYMIFLVLFLCYPGIRAENSDSVTVNIPVNAEDISPVLTGSKIPDVTFTDISGNEVNLRQYVSLKPVILIFYRGGWCPYCNLQLNQLQKINPELQELGYEILAVSPDRPEELKKSIEKNTLDYTLLSDSSMKAGIEFGIVFRVSDEIIEMYKKYNIDLESSSGMSHHLLPVPSVFIISADGFIKFEYVNPDYKIRLDPEVLLAAARSALK